MNKLVRHYGIQLEVTLSEECREIERKKEIIHRRKIIELLSMSLITMSKLLFKHKIE